MSTRTKLTSLVTCVLLVALLLCTAFTAMATSGSESGESNAAPAYTLPTIGSKNVAYGGYLHLAVQLVGIQEDYIEAGYKYGLAVFEADTEDYENATPLYVTYTILDSQPRSGELVKYCQTQGISAKDIQTEYRLVPILVVDGVTYYGSGEDYSVWTYCDDREDDSNVTAEQRALYKATKDYFIAANKVLNKSNESN